MASLGSIYVDILARTGQFDKNMQNSTRTVNNATRSWQASLNRAAQDFSNYTNVAQNSIISLSNTLRGLAGTFASAFSAREVIRYSDAWKQLEGRLRIVSGDMGEVARSQESLYDIAQRTRQPLEGIVNFYTRLTQFIPEAERAQYDLLGVTESVSAALAITGETSASASSAMIQFTQAIGTNFEAAGQELRSLQEQAPRLTQALMRALGDGTKSLQQLKDEGKLTRQSVLNALSGAGEEGRRLAEELAKIETTVAQAFTRLDNAFLKYIGQSDAVNSGTSSIAAGLTALAENFDAVANAIIIAATALSARFVVGLLASAAAAVSSTIAYVQLTYAIVRMGTASAASAVAMTGLMTVTRAAGAAIALLGGPIGLAAVAAITAFTLHTDEAKAAEERYNKAIGDTIKGYGDYANASAEARKKIVADAEERQKVIQRELNEVERLVLGYAALDPNSALDTLEVGVRELFGKMGFGRAPSEVIAQYDAAQKALKELQQAREDFESGSNRVGTGTGKVDKEAQKANESIQKMIMTLREQVDTLGLSESAIIRYRVTHGELAETLRKTGDRADIYAAQLIELTEALEASKARETVDDMVKALEQQVAVMNLSESETIRYRIEQGDLAETFALLGDEADSLKEKIVGLTQQTEESKDTWADWGKFGERAAENIQDAFADFLFDPFDQGLQGMAKGFVDVIRKMIAEAQAAQLAKWLFGGMIDGGKGAGVLGSVLGGLFGQSQQVGFAASKAGTYGPFPQFADGGFLQPGQWGVAGEKEAELIYGGRTGMTVIPPDKMGGKGNVYNIDARGADSGAVRRLEQALLVMAGPGTFEKRFKDAEVRGAL